MFRPVVREKNWFGELRYLILFIHAVIDPKYLDDMHQHDNLFMSHSPTAALFVPFQNIYRLTKTNNCARQPDYVMVGRKKK